MYLQQWFKSYYTELSRAGSYITLYSHSVLLCEYLSIGTFLFNSILTYIFVFAQCITVRILVNKNLSIQLHFNIYFYLKSQCLIWVYELPCFIEDFSSTPIKKQVNFLRKKLVWLFDLEATLDLILCTRKRNLIYLVVFRNSLVLHSDDWKHKISI